MVVDKLTSGAFTPRSSTTAHRVQSTADPAADHGGQRPKGPAVLPE